MKIIKAFNRLLYSLVFSLFITNMAIGQVENNVQYSKDSAEYLSNKEVNIGYGNVNKNNITGSVVIVDSDQFNRGFIISPQELIMGKVAGLSISSNSGMPGRDYTMIHRGTNNLYFNYSPLIIVDDMILNNDLSGLNPNDIESITFLKDASAAAIYGGRASNGVIIITTKNGTKGKLKVAFSSQVSISSPVKFVDVLTGDEYRELINSRVAAGKPGLDSSIAARMGNENTDWQSEIFRNSISTNDNLSISGSIQNIPFRASYGFANQQGILKTTKTSRHTLSLKLNPSVFDDHLNIDINVKSAFSNTNFGVPEAFGSAVKFDPTQPIKNNNTLYGGYFQWTEENLPDGSMDPDGIATTFVENPVAQLALRNNIADVNRIMGNIYLDYKLHFFPDLKVNLNLGTDRTNTVGKNDYLPGSTFTIRGYNDEFGRKYDYTNSYESELLESYLKYSKKIGIHEFSLSAGYSWQHWRRGATVFDRNTAEDYIVTDTRYLRISLTDSVKTDNPIDSYLTSLYGRLIYTLNNKYIMSASLRQDGSSRFVGDDKFGLFPSLALAWKINEESFLSGVQAISQMKLRLGYGVTGQQGLDPTNPDVSGAYYPAITKYGLGNGNANYTTNLKWEETTTYNMGLDFGMWDNKLTGSVDMFIREIDDITVPVPVADGSNFGNYILTNTGNMSIQGYEVTLNYRAISTPDLRWSVGANLLYNKRNITKLFQTENTSSPGVETGIQVTVGGLGTFVQIHTVGQEPYSFYTFQQVYNANGDPIEGVYVDRTGEGGVITDNLFNRYHNHSHDADYLIGLHSKLNYKNLDFSFTGRISLGNYNYNNIQAQSLAGLYQNGIYFVNIPKDALEIGFEYSQPYSDIYVQNASFFKMDHISVGYTFAKLVKDIKARIGFTVQNAFIITPYKGLDPEVVGGIDTYSYPRPRLYSLELIVNF